MLFHKLANMAAAFTYTSYMIFLSLLLNCAMAQTYDPTFHWTCIEPHKRCIGVDGSDDCQS